jgi:dihydrolipoamide dehydrogenase
MEQYDLVVIGAGPGGYVAAIKAAKLGMKTAIVESREVGGTCLNRGCIPTKTLMHSSHLYYEAKNFEKSGIHISDLSYDLDKFYERKDEVVIKVRRGVETLLKANGVTLIPGVATIMNPHRIQINENKLMKPKDSELSNSVDKETQAQEEKQIVKETQAQAEKQRYKEKQVQEEKQFDKEIQVQDKTQVSEINTKFILIATGSTPYLPPIEGIHSKGVVTSDELLAGNHYNFKKLLIIGGGVIGVEFATIYNELGIEVEIIEAMDRILPTMDKEISQSIAMNLKKKGIVIHTKCKVTRIVERDDQKISCEFMDKNEKILNKETEMILVSVGRKSNTEYLFGTELQIVMESDKIKVNSELQTNISNIYAIGDVMKGSQLAHAASAAGIVAVENMLSLKNSINLNVIPSCIYTNPEIATVGLTEEEAKEYGYEVKTGKYPMLGNCKTLLSMDERGYIKVICDGKSDKIIGAQLVCARATDMIGEFASAIVNELTYHDMARVIRPHPTYNEAITEVMEDVDYMAIHLMPQKKN